MAAGITEASTRTRLRPTVGADGRELRAAVLTEDSSGAVIVAAGRAVHDSLLRALSHIGNVLSHRYAQAGLCGLGFSASEVSSSYDE